MMHGLFAMNRERLQEAYNRAMQQGSYATAERIAAHMNWPRETYVYPPRRGDKVA